MYYYVEVDNPPLTLESTPRITVIKLALGRLDFVDIGFPDWNSRLGKCRLLYNTIQFLPMNRNGWFTGDDITVRVPVNLMLDDEPYQITILSINDDDTFSHEISFGFSLDVGEIQGMQGLQSLVPPILVQEGE